MKFEINGTGKFLVQRQSKEIVKFIIGGILLFLIFYIGIKYGMEVKMFQLIMYLWAIVIALVTAFYIPINLKNKIKKIIMEIEFSEKQIIVETKKGVFYLENFQIQKVKNRFSGFGKPHTDGYILRNVNEAQEYWLIATFFNDIEEIESELKKYM